MIINGLGVQKCTALARYLYGYHIKFLPKKSTLFQFEIALSDIWIFLTPKWGRGNICFTRKPNSIFYTTDITYKTLVC